MTRSYQVFFVFSVVLFVCSCTLISQKPLYYNAVEKHQLKAAISAISKMRTVNAFLKLNNSLIEEHVKTTFKKGEFRGIVLSEVALFPSSQSFLIKAAGEVTTGELSGTKFEVVGYINIVSTGHSLVWIPYFETVKLRDISSISSGLVDRTSNALIGAVLKKLNGMYVADLLSKGDNQILIGSIPLDKIEIDSSVSRDGASFSQVAGHLGGVFTSGGAALKIEPNYTSIAMDLRFYGAISNCESDLKLERGLFTSSVIEKEPTQVSKTILKEESVKHFFTQISGAHKKTEIVHIWLANGEVVASVPLLIDKSVEGWRTWSNKQLKMPKKVHTWEVIVVEKDTGCILGNRAISVVKPIIAAENPPAIDVDQLRSKWTKLFATKVEGINISESKPKEFAIELKQTLISKVLNGVLDKTILTANYDTSKFSIPSVEGKRLNIFDHEQKECGLKECKKERHCKADYSHCSNNHDTRDCRRTLGSAFGHKIRVNDPVCEAAKAAQNAIYNTERNICTTKENAAVFDCNRIKEMNYAKCQVDAVADKAYCETVKEAIKRFQQIGAQAHVSAKGQMEGVLQATFNDFKFDENLDLLKFSLLLDSKATLKGRIDWDSKNLGHLFICVNDWSDDFKTKILIQSELLAMQGKLEYKTDKIEITWQPQNVDIMFSPAPIHAIFFGKPNNVINCATGLKLATEFGDEDDVFFSGKDKLEIKNEKTNINLKTIDLLIGNRKIEITPNFVGKSLVAIN